MADNAIWLLVLGILFLAYNVRNMQRVIRKQGMYILNLKDSASQLDKERSRLMVMKNSSDHTVMLMALDSKIDTFIHRVHVCSVIFKKDIKNLETYCEKYYLDENKDIAD